MKKHLLLGLSIVFLAGSAFAQNDTQNLNTPWAREKVYRKSIAEKFKNHIPKGWVIESVAEGDLNLDGIPDIVFVTSDREREDFLRNNSPDSPLYSKIFIFMNEGDQYSLFQQGSYYDVDGRTEGHRGLPTIYLEIEKGVLLILQETPYPSWIEYRQFRMENNRLRLIGKNSVILRGGFAVSEKVSYNLLTGKCNEKTDIATDDETEKRKIMNDFEVEEKTVWKRIKGNRKIYFGENDEDLKCE